MGRVVLHCKDKQIVIETQQRIEEKLDTIDGTVSISFGAKEEIPKDFFPFIEKGRAYRINRLGYRMYYKA
jgi:hypothetical protein